MKIAQDENSVINDDKSVKNNKNLLSEDRNENDRWQSSSAHLSTNNSPDSALIISINIQQLERYGIFSTISTAMAVILMHGVFTNGVLVPNVII